MAVGEWDQRQLCSDGGCVGVIGPDGTCKVCGRAAQNWGDERKRGLIEPAEDDADDEADEDALAAHADAAAPDDDDGYDEDDDEDLEDEGDDEGEGEDEDDGEDDLDDEHVSPPAASSSSIRATPVEWGTRQLCPDGSCIGLIGPEGRCKVCGRAATGAPAPTSSDGAPAASDGEPAAPPAGFTIVTTDAAVQTTDDAVQTTESTVKAGAPEASEPASPAPGIADPDSKAPDR